VDLDVDISAEQIIETSDPDPRSKTVNLRVSPEILADLELFAFFLTEKRRLKFKSAREIARSEAMVRLMRVGMASAWAKESLPERPTKAEVAARLRALKTSV
jgi:hypothetical protein